MERHDGLYPGPVRVRTPLRAAAVLLGIYVTMYLAVAGALHAVRGPDPAAGGVPDPAIVVASCGQRS